MNRKIKLRLVASENQPPSDNAPTDKNHSNPQNPQNPGPTDPTPQPPGPQQPEPPSPIPIQDPILVPLQGSKIIVREKSYPNTFSLAPDAASFKLSDAQFLHRAPGFAS